MVEAEVKAENWLMIAVNLPFKLIALPATEHLSNSTLQYFSRFKGI